MASLFLCIFLTLLSSGFVRASYTPWHLRNYDCAGKPDGLKEFGCWGRLDCVNEKVKVVTCFPKLVYSRDDKKCVVYGEGNTDCNLNTSCDGLKDGNYADVDDGCETFYSCFQKRFVGRQYCSANLRFNNKNKICDFPRSFTCKA